MKMSHKRKFYQLLFKKKNAYGLKNTLLSELKRLNHNDQISILWLLSHMKRNSRPFTYKSHSHNKNHKNFQNRNRKFNKMTTPIRSNTHGRYNKDEAKDTTFALNVEHELLAKNHLPAHDLERGWVIDSGASAHMTPFKKDCREI